MGFTVFRAPRGASLMNRKAWTQGPVSAPLAQLIPATAGAGFAVPLAGASLAWRDPVLVKLADPAHPWHAAGTVQVLGATSSGRQHWAAMLRLATADLTLSATPAPDGGPWVWLPLPGGHEKFDLFYDESGRQYWLVGQHQVIGQKDGKGLVAPHRARHGNRMTQPQGVGLAQVNDADVAGNNGATCSSKAFFPFFSSSASSS